MEEIVVGDDCSIPEDERSVAGRRGLVGMLFVIKIAGALAERGSPLCEVVEIARHVSRSVATYGVGLSACAIPGTRQSRLVSYHYARAAIIVTIITHGIMAARSSPQLLPDRSVSWPPRRAPLSFNFPISSPSGTLRSLPHPFLSFGDRKKGEGACTPRCGILCPLEIP